MIGLIHISWHAKVESTLSHGNSYVFYEVANSYFVHLTCTILYDLSKPQWRVGLGAGLGVGQWFSNMSYKHPCPAHFVCLPYQTHLIQLISSSVETARPELGVPDKGDIQNVQGRGACRTGLKTTGVGHSYKFIRIGNS